MATSTWRSDIGIGGLHLKDAGIVGARGFIGALDQFDAFGKRHFIGRRAAWDKDCARCASSKPVLTTLAGPRAMQRGHVSGIEDLFGAEIVAVGVAGAFAGDDANADAQRDALGGAFDDAFIDADGSGGEVFEVEVGILAAGGERFA